MSNFQKQKLSSNIELQYANVSPKIKGRSRKFHQGQGPDNFYLFLFVFLVINAV